MRIARIMGVVFLLFISPACAQGFFNDLPDVPLMSGLAEIEARGLSFDKPQGRILIAAAYIDDSISNESLQSFYAKALPQFGWTGINALSYARGQEKLSMTFIREEQKRILEITISP